MSVFRISIRKSLFVLAAVALLAAFSLGSDSNTASAATSIDVGDEWFCSGSFQGGVCETTITVGTLVTWTWVGVLPHNTVGASWASPIQTSGTYSRLFDTPGEFTYLCTVHPATMNGKIIVSGTAVGGIAELPGLSTASQLTADASHDRSVLIGVILAAALASIVVVGSGWLMLRRRA